MTRRVRVRPDRLTEPALWLDCLTQDEIAAEMDAPRKTIADWLTGENAKVSVFASPANRATPPGATEDRPWGNIAHFDIPGLLPGERRAGYSFPSAPVTVCSGDASCIT